MIFQIIMNLDSGWITLLGDLKKFKSRYIKTNLVKDLFRKCVA